MKRKKDSPFPLLEINMDEYILLQQWKYDFDNVGSRYIFKCQIRVAENSISGDASKV